MEILKLDDNHLMAIENHGKQVRLVVYNNGVENVCRKSPRKNIAAFIQSGENHLFKGRLQLHKNGGAVNILVKGSKMGEISVAGLLNSLDCIEQ